MKENNNSYRSILKGTSIFGGVQMVQILISLLRGKFVALLLGPAGMGVNAIFSSAHQTLVQISGLGLNLAIVKQIASASGEEDTEQLATTVAIARRLTTVTALLGAIVCLLFAVPLSRLSFGSESYAWGFRLLSLAVFFSVAGAGLLSVLQGLHCVKRLSKASLAGGATALFAGVPLYYFFGTSGIVPALVLMTFVTYLFYRISTDRETRTYRRSVNLREHRPMVKSLILMGLILVAGDLATTATTYAINLVVRHWGSLADVGLFQGANSLTNQYAGVVFTAMMLDYFPRLAAAKESSREMRVIICRQTEIVALIATPLMSLLILSSPLVIRLLLSAEFAAIVPLMRWLGLGILVKALSYPLGWITFAKDNRRVFFWMEVVGANLLTLLLSIGGYLLFGLIGLGYALLADSFICLIVYAIVNHRLYGLSPDRDSIVAIFLSIASGAGVFLTAFLSDRHPLPGYLLGGLLTLLITLFCIRGLIIRFRNKE